jgi:hypothetical protein
MEKTGRSEQALQTRDKAAQAFKKLDYSRFLQMMKRSKEPEKPAVQKHSRTQADLQGR